MSSRVTADAPGRASLGAVLAGGLGTRMGGPKPAMDLAGRPLIACPIETVVAAGLEPLVVAKDAGELPPLDCPVVRDSDGRAHPAVGILAALRASGGAPLVVLACDMPFVPPALVAHLAALPAPVAIPRVAQRLQPLLARYTRPAVPALEAAIERDEPLHLAMGRLDPLVLDHEALAEFGDPERIAFNVNDRRDLKRAERLLGAAAWR